VPDTYEIVQYEYVSLYRV